LQTLQALNQKPLHHHPQLNYVFVSHKCSQVHKSLWFRTTEHFTISYRQQDQFSVKEGKLVKYKGHKSVTMEQLSIRAKHTQSRRHISPVANGMINNEDGGINHMGVQDNGLIDNLMLSKHNKNTLLRTSLTLLINFDQKYHVTFMKSISFESNSLTRKQKRKKPIYQMKQTSRICLELQSSVDVTTEQ
jgi:hypothetical protein